KSDRGRSRVGVSLRARSEDRGGAIPPRSRVTIPHGGRLDNMGPCGRFGGPGPGVGGLVHVSELSWTRQNLNPEGEFEKGAEIQVFVKAIDMEKKEMSLSVREVEGNPWEKIAESYQPGTVIEATVKNLASYGAFVEIEEGIDGLLHNTDFHWTRKIQHPSEIVKKGDRIQCVVLNVDREKQRISLGMKQLTKNPWEDYIPSNYHMGDMLAGTITKNISAGAFVKLEEDLEAFMHFSSLPQEWQSDPESHCLSGLRVEVRVVRVDCGEERIGLSFIHAEFEENDEVRAKWVEQKEKKKAKAEKKAAAKAEAGAEGADDAGDAEDAEDAEGAGDADAGEPVAAAESGAAAEEPAAEEPAAEEPAEAVAVEAAAAPEAAADPAEESKTE
ncbi:MAG: S1 RNA-binding domain-containing protein, partial [Planctomycetes bacterium]|nr:S1 RNA-binding domain-containing protein [Planctomycetota bacterium]